MLPKHFHRNILLAMVRSSHKASTFPRAVRRHPCARQINSSFFLINLIFHFSLYLFFFDLTLHFSFIFVSVTAFSAIFFTLSATSTSSLSSPTSLSTFVSTSFIYHCILHLPPPPTPYFSHLPTHHVSCCLTISNVLGSLRPTGFGAYM